MQSPIKKTKTQELNIKEGLSKKAERKFLKRVREIERREQAKKQQNEMNKSSIESSAGGIKILTAQLELHRGRAAEMPKPTDYMTPEQGSRIHNRALLPMGPRV